MKSRLRRLEIQFKGSENHDRPLCVVVQFVERILPEDYCIIHPVDGAEVERAIQSGGLPIVVHQEETCRVCLARKQGQGGRGEGYQLGESYADESEEKQ